MPYQSTIMGLGITKYSTWDTNYNTTAWQTLTCNFLQQFIFLSRGNIPSVEIGSGQTLQSLHFYTYATSFNVFFTNITNSIQVFFKKKTSFRTDWKDKGSLAYRQL